MGVWDGLSRTQLAVWPQKVTPEVKRRCLGRRTSFQKTAVLWTQTPRPPLMTRPKERMN